MMYEFRLLDEENAECIVKWNAGKDADFLMKWAGLGFTYPITKEQLMKDAAELSSAAFAVFSQEKMIGTIVGKWLERIADGFEEGKGKSPEFPTLVKHQFPGQ